MLLKLVENRGIKDKLLFANFKASRICLFCLFFWIEIDQISRTFKARLQCHRTLTYYHWKIEVKHEPMIGGGCVLRIKRKMDGIMCRNYPKAFLLNILFNNTPIISTLSPLLSLSCFFFHHYKLLNLWKSCDCDSQCKKEQSSNCFLFFISTKKKRKGLVKYQCQGRCSIGWEVNTAWKPLSLKLASEKNRKHMILECLVV